MKKTIAVLMAVLTFMSVFCCEAFGAAEKDATVCRDVTDTANYIFDAGDGEIVLGPAVLTENGKDTDIYFVSVNGMCYNMKKANNIPACVLAAFNLPCKYYKMVKGAMLENIPEGSAVVIAGHSLGGMIAQKIICDEEITQAYEILYTITVGSPYIMVKKSRREGELIRFADVSDNVPKLSPALLFSRKNHKNAFFEDGGYNGDIDAAHNKSYREANVWKGYDAIGTKGGKAEISYRESELISVVS